MIGGCFAFFSNAQSAVYYPYETSLRVEIFKDHSSASNIVYLSDELSTEELTATPCDDHKDCKKKKCKKKAKGCCADKAGAAKTGCSHGQAADAPKAGCSHGHAATGTEAPKHDCKPGCQKACCAGKKVEE